MKKTESLELIIGDKNLSSWSMRPWLVLKASGLPFKETKILLDRPDTAKKIKKHSPTGKVPVLKHGSRFPIWDSLSICEYIAELAPEKNLWPEDPEWRGIARSFAAEMHSGFTSLRSQLSMDIQLRTQIKHLTPQTIADIDRILHIWKMSMKTLGGPYLFKDFTIADAFFAPVVMRFVSYGIEISDKPTRAYMNHILKNPHVKEWIAGAKKEKAHIVKF